MLNLTDQVLLSKNTSEGQTKWTKKTGYLMISSLMLAFLLCVYFEVEFFYALVLFGLIVLFTSLINFKAAFLFVPLTLTNPYTLAETGTRLHLSELVLLIIFSVWFIRVLLQKEKYYFPKQFLYPSLIIIIASLISLLVARNLVTGIQQVVRYIEVFIILFFIVINTFNDEKSIKQIFLFLIIGGLLASLVGLGQFITGELTRGATRRIFGWHGGGYGALIASTLIFCLSALFEKEKKYKYLALLTIPFAGFALVLSQTRAWIATFGIVTIIIFLFLKKKVFGRILLILGIIFCGFLIILQTNAFGLVEGNLLRNAIDTAFRFGSEPGKRSFEDFSLYLRFSVWKHAINIFFNNPILGIGVGNLRFSDYLAGRLGPAEEGIGYVDNQYIQFFTEAGIFAGLAWLFYIFKIIQIGSTTLKNSIHTSLHAQSLALFGSLLIFIIGSFFWVITPTHDLFALMILNSGLLINISNLIKNRELGN
ncbi:MAG: hypothetical protein C0412_01480 [Flavobacterium sp.]|nr:hypothetical protein [Flavobacterium sp.]